MTDKEWEKVADKLDDVFGRVKLKVDGYELTLCVVRTTKMSLEIAVYVNGTIKGADIINDCDIRRKFYQEHVKSILTVQDKKMLRGISKSKRKEIEENSKISWYEPCWQSFRSLKKHLIKNNVSIELMEDEVI